MTRLRGKKKSNLRILSTFSLCSMKNIGIYIPLTNRARGPYCEVTDGADHKSTGKNEDPYLTVRAEKTRLARYSLYL